jgi:hypothetical protein
MRQIFKFTITASLLALASVSAFAKDTLKAGERLASNQYLQSLNGSYKLYLQGDGNLVLRNAASSALWASGTNGKGAVRLDMQGDGNLVLYTSANKAVWATGTNGKGANRAVLQDSGNFALFTASNQSVWATNTGGTTPPPPPPPPPVGSFARVAFVGDSGYGSNFQSVLNLIKSEGAGMTMFVGDTAYGSGGDDDWDSRVRNTLGSSDPVLLAVGNHDISDSNFSTVRSFAQARLNKQSNVKCSGTYAEKMTCTYKNVYFVVSSVGTTGSISDREAFLASSLNNAPKGAWRICAWHKNQRKMQVGGKTDETGWGSYSTCRQKGALIATGHEHSYSRTHLLSSMSNQTVASTTSPYTVTEGKTIAFVSGLGGVGIRDQEIGGNWWAKVYSASQGATYGVLFGDFYADHADFYFKNIKGQIIDKFTVKKGY